MKRSPLEQAAINYVQIMASYQQVSSADPQFQSALAKEIGGQVELCWEELQCAACAAELSKPKTNITEKLGIGRPDLPLDHIDNGPFLPGCKPRKQPAPKSAEEWRTIREKAWETRRNGERKGK